MPLFCAVSMRRCSSRSRVLVEKNKEISAELRLTANGGVTVLTAETPGVRKQPADREKHELGHREAVTLTGNVYSPQLSECAQS